MADIKDQASSRSAAGVAGAVPTRRGASRGLLLSLICVGIFIVYLDATIVNVALPAIGNDLGGTLTDLQWVINAYILVFACLLLTAGALGDTLGRGRVFVAGLAGFTVASALCALAPTTGLLFAGRAVQGMFGAVLIPVSLALANDLYTDAKGRAKALGIWAGVGGIALVAGPVLGGPLVQQFGWRSVFWLNVPIGIAVGVALLMMPPASVRRPRRLDLVGQFLLVIAIGGLTFGLLEGNVSGWTATRVLVGFGIAVLALPAFLLWEARVDKPLLPLRLLRYRVVVAACVVNFLGLFGLFGSLFLLSIYLQDIQGLSATQTGVRLLALTATIMVGSYVASVLAAKTGARWLVVGGSAATAVGLFLLAQIQVGSGFGSYALGLCLLGTGVAFTGAPATVTLMASVPPSEAGLVSGVYNTFRQIGAVFGIALSGLLLIQHMRTALPAAFAQLPVTDEQRAGIVDAFATGDTSRSAQLAAPLRRAILDAGSPVFTDGMQLALIVAGIGAILGGVFAAWLFRSGTPTADVELS